MQACPWNNHKWTLRVARIRDVALDEGKDIRIIPRMPSRQILAGTLQDAVWQALDQGLLRSSPKTWEKV